MNEVFQTNDCPYDLKNPRILSSKHKSTIKYGINTIASNLAKYSLRNKKLGLFKSNIKQMQSLPCRCKICRSFIANLGCIDWSFFPHTKILFMKYEVGRF